MPLVTTTRCDGSRAIEKNLRLYPLYRITASLYFWLPVFFLYFESVVTAGEVLLLEALYYGGVVVFEVPSGYFSDRVGRRLTLIIAAIATVAGSLLFYFDRSFGSFAGAQLLFAIGGAFRSGTDSALLYDSLEGTGREGQYAVLEGRAHSLGFLAVAGAALTGGLCASLDLGLAYLLFAVGAGVNLVVCLRFEEPASDGHAGFSPLAQMSAVLGALKSPLLAWVFTYSVLLIVFEHVPFELFQPYLDLLLEERGAQATRTPALAGLVVAVMMLLSSVASARAVAVERRLGTRGTLLAALLIQGVILFAMSAALHPLVALLILLRSVPAALSLPVLNAAIHPRITSRLRATFLSFQSLAGRLAFSGTLLLAARAAGGTERLQYERLAAIARAYGIALVILWLALAALSKPLSRPAAASPPASRGRPPGDG